ncbi:MAG: cupredoxin domain-containing protein [Candidatus Nitrosopumilus sp. bin_68KS]
MTGKVIFVLLGLFIFLPLTTASAYAENSWTVSIKPYDEFGKKELFQPRELPIMSGDKVIWKNNDSTSHKIVSGIPQHPDYAGEFFSTNVISSGSDNSISLDFKGYAGYYYFCEIHPWYTGKIFFEERPGIFNSTLGTSYKILDENTLSVGGLVESDLRNTEYEMLVFDSKNNLVHQNIQSFESDASFNQIIDISDSLWKKDENFTLKLVFGVPSESTSIPIKIPINQTYEKSKYLEFCQDFRTESNFLFEEIQLPNWYKKTLCWYGNKIITEKELLDSLNFFNNIV